jgi:CheY-like chemotaxis protein
MEAEVMKTVLIVDDETDFADVLGHVLTDVGYRVLKAQNGEEGLRQLAENRAAPPDLMLVDLMMPVMDGRSMLLAMQSDEALRTIPVLVMSAGDASSTADELRRPMIRKPFGLRVLLDRIHKIIGA